MDDFREARAPNRFRDSTPNANSSPAPSSRSASAPGQPLLLNSPTFPEETSRMGDGCLAPPAMLDVDIPNHTMREERNQQPGQTLHEKLVPGKSPNRAMNFEIQFCRAALRQ